MSEKAKKKVTLSSIWRKLKKSEKIILAVAAAAVAVLVIVTVVLAVALGSRAPRENAAESGTAEGGGELLDIFDKKYENDGVNGGYASYVLFGVRAKATVSTLGRRHLWNTDVFDLFDHDGDWYGFTLESSLEGCPFSIRFKNGNERIIASMCDLREDQLEGAYMIFECLIDTVENTTVPGLYGFFTDENAYPWQVEDDPYYSILSEIGLRGDVYAGRHDDGAGDVCRSKTLHVAANADGNALRYVLRERTVGGEKRYDMFFDFS